MLDVTVLILLSQELARSHYSIIAAEHAGSMKAFQEAHA